MNSRLVRVLGTAALVFAVPALGAVVVAATVEEMAQASHVVVRGRVGQVQVAWDEGQNRIWTRAEIQVLESLKGNATPIILVRQPGGEVGNIGQRVEGVARFTQGEEALFFLETVPDEPNVYTVYALAAGKVNFEKSRVGEVRAVRHLDGLAFYSLPSKKVVMPVGNTDDLGTPAEVLARVKQAVLRLGKGGAR